MNSENGLPNQKVNVMPGKAASIMLVVLGTAFLIFGAVFVFSQVANVSSGEGELKILLSLFGVIWVLACGSMAGYGGYCLTRRKPASLYTLEFEADPSSLESGKAGSSDFDARLRKIETLKKEGLITDEEYNRKRSEIMREQW